jgi:hypothetical protein
MTHAVSVAAESTGAVTFHFRSRCVPGLGSDDLSMLEPRSVFSEPVLAMVLDVE